MAIRPVEVHVWWKLRTESLNSLKIGTILKDPSIDHDDIEPGTQNIGRLSPIPFNAVITVDLFYQSVSANGKKRRIEWLDTKVTKTIVDAGGISETDGFIGLNNLDNLNDGDLLRIENEIVYIIDAGSNPVTVYRGQHGTEAVAHVNGETCIKIICSVPYNSKVLNGRVDVLDPPLNLVATGVVGGVRLTWDAYTEPDRRLFSYFRVYRRETLADYPDPPDFDLADLIAECSDNEYFDTSVTELVSYTYWITGVDTSGNESDPSSPDAATPLSIGDYKVPDDLRCIAIANGNDILCGCIADKWNHGITEAEFRAKWYAVGTTLDFADLRTVAEGGTFVGGTATEILATGVGATFAGANYSWTSASPGVWYYAFKLKNASGWSVWSDGNDTPQHVGDFINTRISSDSGPPSNWTLTGESGPSPYTVVARAGRPQTNGNVIWFVTFQIMDTSAGSWYDLDANAGPAVTYYNGASNEHTITQSVTGGLRVTRNSGAGFNTANENDLMVLDVREGSGSFDIDHCIWGVVARFQNDDPPNATWFEVDVPYHSFYAGTNWRLKIVKPPWAWNTDGYFGGAVPGNGIGDVVPQPWEYGGDESSLEFVSPPMAYPDTVALDDIGVRCFYQNAYSRSDGNITITGITSYAVEEGPFVLGITVDGGGSVPSTGVAGYLQIPFNCTINSWTMLANLSGSAVIDIWKDTYANFPPTDADSITAAAQPTLSTQNKNSSDVLTGWTVDLDVGDILAFNLDSISTITRLHLQLNVTKR